MLRSDVDAKAVCDKLREKGSHGSQIKSYDETREDGSEGEGRGRGRGKAILRCQN